MSAGCRRMGVYFMADGDGSKFVKILGLGCLIA